MLLTFPDCTTKTLEELRKPKLDAWNRNKENSRAWLALNMMTEARAGFTAFNEGPKDDREVDFVLLRRSSPPARAGRAAARQHPTRGEARWLSSPIGTSPLRVHLERDGALLRLTLDRRRPT